MTDTTLTACCAATCPHDADGGARLVTLTRGEDTTAILCMHHYETEQWWDATVETINGLIADGFTFHTEGVDADEPSPTLDLVADIGKIMTRGGLTFQHDAIGHIVSPLATRHDLAMSQINAVTPAYGRLGTRLLARFACRLTAKMGDSEAAEFADTAVSYFRKGPKTPFMWRFLTIGQSSAAREEHAVAARIADPASKVCMVWGEGHLPGLVAGLRARGWQTEEGQ